MFEFAKPEMVTSLSLFIVVVILVAIISASLPLSLWRYLRAKEIAPMLHKKSLLEAELQQLKDACDKFAESVVEARELIVQGKMAKQYIEDNTKLIEDLKVQVVKMKEEFEVAKTQLDDLKQKVSGKMSELAEINTKLQAVEEKLSGIEKEHQQTVDELENRKADLKKDVAQLGADKAALLSETNSLSKSVDELRREHDKLKQENDSLLKEVAENRALKDANESLLRDNAKISKELDALKVKAESAKDVIARSESIKNNEANMWKDLERPVVKMQKDKAKPVITDENVALKGFIRGLDQSGYSFRERTIKAFHTGLLCGDVSPLVVLSGVSGTGKSLLPELYAKAFGLNFLSVAVQPRWDGPQDVFGFYNHMEGRFKATELSRLLWQFDRFNNPQAREKYGEDFRRLPLSMVLLDEMNLARVEYYFSELLSKLEVRNRVLKIGEDDAEQRRMSEVELEYGASSVADEAVVLKNDRRLYVGRNILFVGTMNEDESTQTLSSKVIDRSNVLRFGTPESLKQEPKPGIFDASCKHFVSYDTWLKWAVDKGESLPELDAYLRTLKDALKQVDRGFGHRTETSIKQYVKYYPGRKMDALADQIEMKILPKLNGIESDLVKTKVKQQVVGVLHAIGDNEVEQALEETLGNDSTFFNFKGVRR